MLGGPNLNYAPKFEHLCDNPSKPNQISLGIKTEKMSSMAQTQLKDIQEDSVNGWSTSTSTFQGTCFRMAVVLP